MFNNRQEDVSKVFDKTWKANHNDDIKVAKQKEKAFMDKMFSSYKEKDEYKPLTPGQRAETLHNNMNNAFSGQKQASFNNIVKKWK